VGISLSITDKKEFHEMCYAFCKTHIIPDFIVVEGCAKEAILLNNVSSDSGMPLFEALQFVAKTLEIYGISKETKIIAASEIHTAFDILKLRALGADALSMRNRLIRSAKPYQKGDINETAFARQSMERLRNEILNSTMDVMQAWGYKHIKDITLSSFFRILDALQMKEDHKGNGRAGRDIVEKKNHRLSQKSLYEKNTGAEVFLN
ncbi:MAG: glutamate synthase-related protein, partial [Ginsengibacter sp.]